MSTTLDAKRGVAVLEAIIIVGLTLVAVGALAQGDSSSTTNILPPAPADGSSAELLRYLVMAAVALGAAFAGGAIWIIRFLITKVTDKQADLAPILEQMRKDFNDREEENRRMMRDYTEASKALATSNNGLADAVSRLERRHSEA